MTRTRTAGLTIAIGAAFLAAPAAASPPEHGSGVGTVAARTTETINTPDDQVIQERRNSGPIVGAFDGVYVLDVRGVVHKTGLVTFHGTMTFTGQAANCGTGTVTLEAEGRALAGAPIADGKLRTIDSADNTIDVHVIGEFHQVGLTFTYDGQFHCGP